MALNHYVTLGKSGLRVSPFCLGAMTFGEDWGWGATEKESQAILDYFIEAGGNFIDTANFYTKGHSEAIIGEHIGRYPAKRDRLIIATKFCGSLYVGDPNGGGANRKSIMAQCEQSLRRLQTDYIDLYWLHCFDKFTPIEETLTALDDLVRSGKVRYIGFSDIPAWKVAQAQTMALLRGLTRIAAIQIEYSLLERTVEGELLPMARDLGIGVTPWSPLKFGVLTGKYRHKKIDKEKVERGTWVTSVLDDPKCMAVVDAVMQIARELNITPANVALAWVQAQQGMASTIIGARTLKQLQENITALDVKLRPQDMILLNDVSKPKLNFPADFLQGVDPFNNGGTTINGEYFPAIDLAPKNDNERY